ncbi:hypothetical protein evm_011537 [Chilo suppressalis]|nr:hypothetical protein evm_011537 [Chilo suppressalis]
MPKRSGDKENRRAKKIRRLEKKLAKYKENTQDGETASTHESDPEICSIIEYVDQNYCEIRELESHNISEQTEELDNSILSALGEAPTNKTLYGNNIHEEIYNAFKNILTEGLSKERKVEILVTLQIPGNCKLLDAPKLNMEIVGVLNNPSKTRDKLLEERQKEMGLAVAGISQVLNAISKKGF